MANAAPCSAASSPALPEATTTCFAPVPFSCARPLATALLNALTVGPPAAATTRRAAFSPAGRCTYKAGRALYVHRPAGLKAARLVVAAAGGPTVKAFKSAVASGLAQLKGTGAKHVVVASGNAGELAAEHGAALAMAASDASYLYRDTKPSAQPAPSFTKFTLLCGKAEAREVQRGLA